MGRGQRQGGPNTTLLEAQQRKFYAYVIMDDPGTSRRSRQEIPMLLRHGPGYRNIVGTTNTLSLLPPFARRDANPLNANPSNQVAGELIATVGLKPKIIASSHSFGHLNNNPHNDAQSPINMDPLLFQLLLTCRATHPLQFLRRMAPSIERSGYGYYRILTSHSSGRHSLPFPSNHNT